MTNKNVNKNMILPKRTLTHIEADTGLTEREVGSGYGNFIHGHFLMGLFVPIVEQMEKIMEIIFSQLTLESFVCHTSQARLTSSDQ